MNERSRVHGLTIEAPFALGSRYDAGVVDLVVADGATILEADQQAEPADPVVAQAGQNRAFYLLIQHSDEHFTLRFRGFGDAVINTTEGRVTWRLLPDADPSWTPIFTGGTVLATVCQLRGWLTLHASAVEIGGRAVAFVGDSGAGKSTLAALACLGGANLVTDDVLRVDLEEGRAWCHRGATTVRLRPGSRALSSCEATTPMSADGRHLVSPAMTALGTLSLGAIVIPRIDPDVATAALRPVDSKSAALSLLAAPRVRGWRHSTAPSLFEHLMDLAGSVPVAELTIPTGFHVESGAAAQLHALLTEIVERPARRAQ